MDRRRYNGGNSTKSKGIDKRKNEYKSALNQAISMQDVIDVLTKLLNQAKNEDEGIQAKKLLLEYCLGKPLDKIEVEQHGTNFQPVVINQVSKARIEEITRKLESEY